MEREPGSPLLSGCGGSRKAACQTIGAFLQSVVTEVTFSRQAPGRRPASACWTSLEVGEFRPRGLCWCGREIIGKLAKSAQLLDDRFLSDRSRASLSSAARERAGKPSAHAKKKPAKVREKTEKQIWEGGAKHEKQLTSHRKTLPGQERESGRGTTSNEHLVLAARAFAPRGRRRFCGPALPAGIQCRL